MTEGAGKQGRGAGAVSHRTASWVALSMWVLSLASTALAALLLVRNLSYPNPYVFDLWVQGIVIPITCSTVGVIIASRRPDHPIGWLFCAVGLLTGVNHFFAEYAILRFSPNPALCRAGESRPGSPPGLGCLPTPCWCS